MLEGLKNSESNKCIRRCSSPKYVFLVSKTSTKQEIGNALEDIYKEQGIKVVGVNTINVKPKTKRRRGKVGQTKAFKKAIVTLEQNDSLDNV